MDDLAKQSQFVAGIRAASACTLTPLRSSAFGLLANRQNKPNLPPSNASAAYENMQNKANLVRSVLVRAYLKTPYGVTTNAGGHAACSGTGAGENEKTKPISPRGRKLSAVIGINETHGRARRYRVSWVLENR